MKEDIIFNLKQVHDRIEQACKNSGREVSDVQLLLATKTVPAGSIRIAIEAGETLIGENKMQEFRDKDSELKDLNIERHFIGHLQTNKVKDVLKYVSCIQSLDRLSLAEELHKQLQKKTGLLMFLFRLILLLKKVNLAFLQLKLFRLLKKSGNMIL